MQAVRDALLGLGRNQSKYEHENRGLFNNESVKESWNVIKAEKKKLTIYAYERIAYYAKQSWSKLQWELSRLQRKY